MMKTFGSDKVCSATSIMNSARERKLALEKYTFGIIFVFFRPSTSKRIFTGFGRLVMRLFFPRLCYYLHLEWFSSGCAVSSSGPHIAAAGAQLRYCQGFPGIMQVQGRIIEIEVPLNLRKVDCISRIRMSLRI